MVAIDLNSTIRTFSKIPKTWGNVLNYDKLTSRHAEDGFKPVVQPQIDSETQRKGAIYFDAENDVFTYAVIDKTPEELEQEKIQKQKIAKEKIKQEKLEQIVNEQVNQDPLSNKDYFDVWTEGAYDSGVYALYKDKLFLNEIQGNTNQPDKGGWKEIKA